MSSYRSSYTSPFSSSSYGTPNYYASSLYKTTSKGPATSTRIGPSSASNFRSTFSPPSVPSSSSAVPSSSHNGRFGGGNPRSYASASEAELNHKRPPDGSRTSYQAAASSNPVASSSADPNKSGRFGATVTTAPEISKTSYTARSNLYKLPANSWARPAGTASGRANGTPSDGSEQNYLMPGSFSSRSRSRDREAESSSGPAKDAPTTTTTSALPRSYRSYNQRSSTSTTFQSPSTYTPRTYGRTASRDLSYASALAKAERPPFIRPTYGSETNNKPPPSPLPAATPMTEEKKLEESDEEESSSEDSDDENDEEEEKAPAGPKEFVVINRGTSPNPLVTSPSSSSTTGGVSSLACTPKPCQIRRPVLVTHEVQTDDVPSPPSSANNSSRPKRFLGYTGAGFVNNSSSPRVGSYADRYFSTCVTPSRRPTTTEEKTATKEPSPPVTKPPIPSGVANKEFRKSALNVDLDDQQATEFRKRQEEFRESQRRAKRQAKRSSGSTSPSTPGSRRNSITTSESKTRISPGKKAQPSTPASVVRSDSRKKVPSPVSKAASVSSSRSSSCSSSSSSEPVLPAAQSKASENSKIKSSSSSGSGSKLPIQQYPIRRKSSLSNSESGSNAGRLLRVPSSSSTASPSVPRSPPSPASIKSRSPSANPIQQQAPSRSPSVNWSTILNMTRGLEGELERRSSTSSESLPSSRMNKNKKPEAVSRSQSRQALKQAASSGSLPPHRSASSRTSSHQNIPSRTASARSIARASSTSTDSSSTESDRVVSSKQSVPSSKRNSGILDVVSGAAGGPESSSSFAAKINSSFGWLRKQNSEIIPWWLASSDNIPAKEQQDGEDPGAHQVQQQQPGDPAEPSFGWLRKQNSDIAPWWLPSTDNIPGKAQEEGAQVEPPAGESSTSSADETQSSTEEEESTESKADTDVEVEDLPVDATKQEDKIPAELGDRSSPDGFEWPDCPSPPLPVRRNNYPSVYRPPSPYDNVADSLSPTHHQEDPVARSAWGLGALRALESSSPPAEVIQHPTQKEEEDVKDSGDESSSSSQEEEEGHGAAQPEPETKGEPSSFVVPPGEGKGSSSSQLEDATFQLYKDGDYANYLDMEATLHEQSEELEGFLENRKNSIVLRTQLSVRVHAIIDKLLHSEGRELRRALFSLKQIFQEDKDLVHEFVQNDGLACLIRVGASADQNYQNYILRALGQVMLYVDGMNGVMEHNPTVQWLYSLITSKYRLVAKTALKLLLVFVEYVKSNCQLLVKAVETVDAGQDGKPCWNSVIRLLQERDSSDSELLVYAVTLINKTLQGLLSSDQDAYYDQIEFLESQGMQQIISRYTARPDGTDAELIQQLEIYELELKQQDDDQSPFVSSNYSKQNRRRTRRSQRQATSQQSNQQAINKRLNSFQLLQTITGGDQLEENGVSSADEQTDKRKSNQSKNHLALLANELATDKSFNQWSSSSESSSPLEDVKIHLLNGSQAGVHPAQTGPNEVGVTPALRRRRERAERQRSLLREQEESGRDLMTVVQPTEDESLADENRRNAELTLTMPPLSERISNLQKEKDKDNGDRSLLDISREASVKDLTERLQANHISGSATSPTSEDKMTHRLGDLSGIISKAKEELTKSKSRHDLRNLNDQQQSNGGTSSSAPAAKVELKKSENELHWESLLETLDRPLQICDLDFTDLLNEEDSDPLDPVRTNSLGPPPPPPPPSGLPPPPMAPPPMPPTMGKSHPASSIFGVQLHHNKSATAAEPATVPSAQASKKSKKTVKLFWREIREDQLSLSKGPTLWDELKPVAIDTQKLEHLFESRSKDLLSKKQQETAKNKELIVLDPKRSNSINIGMTKLPPTRTIKTAILKMDSTIINREGIEKLLTMLPTEEERIKIQEAQLVNPELPLGSAEQFLLSLASITELAARLKLWLFKSDYENMEKEVAEPLMDLKQGIDILQSNATFRAILATLLAVGNFLNGAEIKGFQVDYLAKVPEVKDTVHKHSLLHHLCHMIMEQNPETTDLYSEIGAVTRASRVDFDELAANLKKMEEDCKASWDHLRAIAKHDGNTPMKIKMSEFLTDCAERIMVSNIVHRRVMNKFRKFLLWLGTPPAAVRETKPGAFCRVVSEFALEYRTTRDRVLQQLEKKANHRERNKTRGKMITQINGYSSLDHTYRSKEDRADAELRQLLGSDISDTESMRTGTWGRSRKAGLGRSTSVRDDYLTDTVTDGDDEILESLVKTATRTPAPRERKRSNRQHSTQAERSSARTRKNGLSEEDRKYLILLATQVAAA